MNELILKNPITNAIKDSVNKSKSRLNFAVPFISSFAMSLFNSEKTNQITEKKILTRFNDSFISSFDLPTLKFLLDLGFEIRFHDVGDGDIHLKMYITDDEAYVTSSNLTRGGFEKNVELTVKIDTENIVICKDFFDEIWRNCEENQITYELINANIDKYELAKRRDIYAKKLEKPIKVTQIPVLGFDSQQIITAIFNQNKDYSKMLRLLFEANKLREETKEKLRKGFSTKLFYIQDVSHPMRKHTLFYDLVYGNEEKLADTGLREAHFKTVFQHQEFEKVIHYIFPEMIGASPWNFQDKNILREFCNGIFDFDIPAYKEAFPIRLASYFYPDLLLPIFKLDHLKKICDAFGFETDAETNGDRLFIYNSFLAEKMKILPFENIIKADIAYQVRYAVELLKRLSNNESYETILGSYNKVWIKGFIKEGKKILIELNKIN